ncbi:hypothetical protein KL953_30175 [Mycolicibacterium goodii]|uniref:hypothetical protein n=1 Tax=Mycolicibacterium goodii TaxID=134601 RepID=UPI001BDBDDD4|nr:hypothetical protein [Mycolicibacterium goodii]MBU8813150.1 hypothetical protein [Mycolicibacterium goodii]
MTTGIVGEWDVTIKTPIGSLQVIYRFVERDGALDGTASSKAETVPLADVQVHEDGRRVVWRQTVSKPMRLKLGFDVRVDGDRLTGHSQAGPLPRSAVTGVRRS